MDVSLISWSREGCFSPPEGMVEMAHGCPAWTSILFRKKLIDDVGLLDIDVGETADYDFQIRTAIRFPIVISKEPCAIFMSHESSVSGGANLAQFWPGWKKMNDKIYGDQGIPLDIRKQAVDFTSEYLRRVLISIAIKEMIKRNPMDLMKISDVLHQYLGLYFTAFMIRIMAGFCRIPGSGQLIAWADRLRRLLSMTERKRSRLNRDYGDYVKWL